MAGNEPILVTVAAGQLGAVVTGDILYVDGGAHFGRW
jgi:hypothetical protein